MPSINDATEPVTYFPNRFVSPFGNDELIPLYSSLPILSPAGKCLECIVCGTVKTRREVLDANSLRGAKLESEVQIAIH